jgi:uncharacterized protein (TIGR01777 family)
MRFLVAGASGFLGNGLVEAARARGDEVVKLVRRPVEADDEVRWDPAAGELAPSALDGIDTVVNVAGSPTIGNPHSSRWRTRLRESRLSTTTTLARAIAKHDARPTFLAGNALGWYGDHGTEVVTEDADSRGESMMTVLCRDWQAAAVPAAQAGSRVVYLRTVPVMDRDSPPLKQLLPLFKLGLGARIGGGRQFFPVVSLRDWTGAVLHLADHHGVHGPANICAPQTPTQAEFTQALAIAVHRKAFLAVPSLAVKVGAGDLADEALGSVNVRPDVLEDSGFTFQDEDVDDVIASALARLR